MLLYVMNTVSLVVSDSIHESSDHIVHDDYFNGSRFGWMILFGIVGVLIRYFLNIFFAHVLKTDTFWSTLIINISGCAIIGVVQVVGVEQMNINIDLRYGLMVGLFGGYTTFSGYCLDTVLLSERNQLKYTIIGIFYCIISPGLGLAATYTAIRLTRKHYE
ncbi:hypothetical protein PPL_08919 [Heterostelium album PN500]|uniref:Fluoride ion transporter CrcB n=1 Tax=Heterostelium pallidum (strain ATCC 26659 / Pp 5 / PN500) TaxID=670386 RepID=D3BK38_HETP5|nr:hypothetical protein PPL_08919 [Heterostelium album PN500]EFA78268.1 hypothetical protein PPL_08919 [Heterostelium album PN500]|eukprot:XP_020430393.1 hypothetical protein PPL_08919 [Heterostelium album PN500]